MLIRRSSSSIPLRPPGGRIAQGSTRSNDAPSSDGNIVQGRKERVGPQSEEMERREEESCQEEGMCCWVSVPPPQGAALVLVFGLGTFSCGGVHGAMLHPELCAALEERSRGWSRRSHHSQWTREGCLLLTALEGALLLRRGHHAGRSEAASSRCRGRGSQPWSSQSGATEGNPGPQDAVNERAGLGCAQRGARRKRRARRGPCQEKDCAFSGHFP